MAYQICFVRGDKIVGYLGREGMDGDVLRESKKEAIEVHDLKAASRYAQEFKKVRLPVSLKRAEARELIMFNFVVDRLEVDEQEGQMVAKFAEKYFIKVVSTASGGAVETHQYEPR